METIEQIAYLVVFIIALIIIAYGLMKLRGTGLLQHRKEDKLDDLFDDFYDSDRWWDEIAITEDYDESKYELIHLEEDDSR